MTDVHRAPSQWKRRLLRGLIWALLISVIAWVDHAALPADAGEVRGQPGPGAGLGEAELFRAHTRWLATAHANTASADDMFSADPLPWWPANVTNAVRAFECSSGTPMPGDARHLVMVWTDKVNNVVAFGSALEAGQIPHYAETLAGAGATDAMQPVRVAATGHRVSSTRNRHVLKAQGIELRCFPSREE